MNATLKKEPLFEIEYFCNIINVFSHFWSINASLLNKSNFKNKKIVKAISFTWHAEILL